MFRETSYFTVLGTKNNNFWSHATQEECACASGYQTKKSQKT